MKDLFTILLIIKDILIHPKKILLSNRLTAYNMKLMKTLIVFILEVSYLMSLFFRTGASVLRFATVGGMLFLLLIFYIGVRIQLGIFNIILKSVVGFKVPFLVMERVYMPYLATSITLSLIFNVTNNLIYNLEIITFIVIVIWQHIQLFNIARYRIMNREMNISERKKLLVRMTALVMVLIFLTIVSHVQQNNRIPIDETENIGIRKEVFEVFYGVYLEIEDSMKLEKKITWERETDLKREMKQVYMESHYVCEGSYRDNEMSMKYWICEMIDAYIDWYKANEDNDQNLMKDNMFRYLIAKDKVEYLIDNFVEK